MMDLVFGVGDGQGDNLFNSCIAQGINCNESLPSPATGTRDVMVNGAGVSIFDPYGFPFPIHQGMHQMFQMYNIGLLVVAVLIATYFIITIIAETAQTGTAFGKRFNKVWAPLRFVFAFGLLIPVGIGFNSSQYAVLYAAKFGSGFATNGWNYFNANIADGYFGDLKNLVSRPNIPELQALMQFFYTARTCSYLEEYGTPERAEEPNPGGEIDPLPARKIVYMWLVKGAAAAGGNEWLRVTPGTTYQALIDFNEGSSTVRIRFGEQHVEYARLLGSVYPDCGEITFKLSDSRDPTAASILDQPEAGVRLMQDYYWTMIKQLWFNTFTNPGAALGFAGLPDQNYPENFVFNNTPWYPGPVYETRPEPDASYKSDVLSAYRTAFAGNMSVALNLLQNSDRYNVNNMVTEKGWAGAAIWYNRIAEMNGAVTTSILNIPYPSLYPSVMEHVLDQKKRFNNRVDFETRFNPEIRGSDPVQFRQDEHAIMADVLWEAYDFWQAGGGGATPQAAPTGNAMIDSINALFGTEGLYNIRRNPDTHPLAQIVGIGRSLIESSIRNLTISVIGGVAGNLLGFLATTPAELIPVITSFLVTVTMVGLTAGFILFYVVPFLPFIYFFFAVGGWIKGIFEAMVGAPLWALAHIRIDQEGLPGQAGVAGYFLIFEIFLRPILIIFGMLASISIFSALVSVLNQIFDLVTTNVGGFDASAEVEGDSPAIGGGTVDIESTIQTARGAIDEFFFTIIYTIIIYLMGMSSFKLIDLIPNNILRWMGQSTATFNDQREDAAQGLVGKATVGSQQTSSALGSGLQSIAGGR